MQKIILKPHPYSSEYIAKSIASNGLYLMALSVVTFVFYRFTSPLFVLQALLSGALIYNLAFAFWGIPPTIDNIYFVELSGESYLYPLPDSSDMKFPFLKSTEIFVCFASAWVYGVLLKDRNEFLNVNNLFTLLLIVYFWRNLILLLRGVYRYGQQALQNSSPRQYVQHERYRKPKHKFLYVLLMIAIYSFFSLGDWL